jgi:hypothetical protein
MMFCMTRQVRGRLWRPKEGCWLSRLGSSRRGRQALRRARNKSGEPLSRPRQAILSFLAFSHQHFIHSPPLITLVACASHRDREAQLQLREEEAKRSEQVLMALAEETKARETAVAKGTAQDYLLHEWSWRSI